MRDTVLGPLDGDEPGHRYRPIASLTQRATDRLRTSRCIRSSTFSLRNRSNSARSLSLTAALPSARLRRSRAHQLPSVPSLMPSSRGTCAIGLPVSNTSRTAPARSLDQTSDTALASLLLKAMSPRYEGKPTRPGPLPMRGWRRPPADARSLPVGRGDDHTSSPPPGPDRSAQPDTVDGVDRRFLAPMAQVPDVCGHGVARRGWCWDVRGPARWPGGWQVGHGADSRQVHGGSARDGRADEFPAEGAHSAGLGPVHL